MAFTAPPASQSTPAPGGGQRYTDFPMALGVITTVFFMWGLLTALNDILIPHLKSTFQLDYAQVMLVQSTFFGAYFLMALPAGKLVARLGYKNGVVAGLAIAGIGALGFWPAAALHLYDAFLGALFVLATGITVLQVAANPYVSLLGPERTSSSRLTLAQALNSLGTALALWFGGKLILSAVVKSPDDIAHMAGADQLAYQAQQAHAVQGPYIGLAIVLFLLAVFVWLFRLPALREATDQADVGHHTYADVLRHPHVLFGVLGIFFYVGAEVSIGSAMVNYLAMPDIGHISEQQAAYYTSFYWGGAMVGRFLGSWLMAFLSPRKLLSVFAVINALLVLTTMSTHGNVAMFSIIIIGLFNSIMFPTIFALGIERLGPMTSKASSLLIMAIVGGAVIPYLLGVLADHIGLQHAFVLPLLCYAYIVFYGVSGSKIRTPTPAAAPTTEASV
ncbi:L-fucose:H+ symporter permease [Rhodanobacter glycinis]|jgi:FHS family L-fucose permease-like MFS transporter|uniref:L-fucose:H+ symporter permease n=2 Tax=Rhodanobacter TaxID=75309 RepID=A0A1I4DYI6_9GAMM|nr:putative transmembrane hexose transporter [Rhodanobacter sp. 115]QEE25837.1 L-fucose:H+ symporter permease [Rhodanobacter glycinis]SFK98688.1 MFS transporter, FHS family, L-fucose permease [Rhodanobacter glycinis]